MRRGTTPTIKFRVYDLDHETIDKAYVALKQSDTILISKEITYVEDGIWTCTLTQEETLKLMATKVFVQLKFKTVTNKVIASNIMERKIDEILDEEVI